MSLLGLTRSFAPILLALSETCLGTTGWHGKSQNRAKCLKSRLLCGRNGYSRSESVWAPGISIVGMVASQGMRIDYYARNNAHCCSWRSTGLSPDELKCTLRLSSNVRFWRAEQTILFRQPVSKIDGGRCISVITSSLFSKPIQNTEVTQEQHPRSKAVESIFIFSRIFDDLVYPKQHIQQHAGLNDCTETKVRWTLFGLKYLSLLSQSRIV